MPTASQITEIDEIEAPWGRNVRIQEVEFDGGAVMLRIRVREGRRFTDLEMTRDVAARIGASLVSWSEVE
ncbi:MAG: hypothetical protein H8E94_00770 [Alphaproteobacteria bacterium]|nr:hypothetical protein [Alphaproteobacteria bacterium]